MDLVVLFSLYCNSVIWWYWWYKILHSFFEIQGFSGNMDWFFPCFLKIIWCGITSSIFVNQISGLDPIMDIFYFSIIVVRQLPIMTLLEFIIFTYIHNFLFFCLKLVFTECLYVYFSWNMWKYMKSEILHLNLIQLLHD